ncbi:MAG: flagellar basal body P-ring formation chaperone FlgA [Phycisphaerae bacterium]
MTNSGAHRQCLKIAAISTAFGWSIAAASAAQIRIWPTAVVTGDGVRLSDVAALTGIDAKIARRWSNVIVHAAPKAGQELLVRLDDVRGALSESGANLATVHIMGASRCRVSKPRPPRTPKAVVSRQHGHHPSRKHLPKRNAAPPHTGSKDVPSGDTLETALRRYVEARAPIGEGRIEIRFGASSRQALALRASEYQFVIRPSKEGGRTRRLGLVSYRVDVLRNNQRFKTVPIVAEVTLLRDVVVARKPINVGQTIEGRHLRLDERRFDDLSKVGLADLAGVIGKEARRFVREGEMLTAKSITARPVVRRGDPVTIWRRATALMIKTSGKALENGALGARIRVRRDGTRRAQDVIDAIVTGPGTVELVDNRRVARR